MPLLFSLGQQRALRAIAGQPKDGERLFAFLDDLCVSCQLWNKAGILPSGVEELQQSASAVDKNAVVWRGDPLLQTSSQGFKILGTPIGHEAFVKAQLMARRADHDVLLERILAVPDLQAAWLLMSYCASARVNFALRTVRPDLVGEFCASHDAAIWKCVTKILGVEASVVPDLTRRTVSLPFSRGGLGIPSASRTYSAAFWASWADGPRSRASDHQRNAPRHPVRVYSRCGAMPRDPQ